MGLIGNVHHALLAFIHVVASLSLAYFCARVSSTGQRLRAHISMHFCVGGGTSLLLGISLLRRSCSVVYDVYLVAYNDTCMCVLVVGRSDLRVLTQFNRLAVY